MAGAVHLFLGAWAQDPAYRPSDSFCFYVKNTFPYSAKNKALKAIYKYVVSSAAINKCDWCKV